MKSRSLFDKGAKALSKYSNFEEKIYACPLCRKRFKESEINLLRREHIPPKSIGGRLIILTCKKCNHSAGHQLENHLKNREYFINFHQVVTGGGVVEGRGSITIEGNHINADFKLEDGKFDIKTRQGNNPLDKIIQHSILESKISNNTWNGTEIKISLDRHRFDPRKAAIAELKSAYLIAFAKLGYNYVFHDYVQPIRQQIIEPDVNIINDDFVFYLASKSNSDLKIAEIISPFRAIAVQINKSLIFLPLVEDALEFYKKLRSDLLNCNFQIQGTEIPFPTTLEMIHDFP